MPMSVRTLPVLQNWDCQGCTDCCREYYVHVTDEERARIEQQGWSALPEFQGLPLFVKTGSRRKAGYRLNHRADGSCVFLGEGGRCKIHEKFGGATKPLACRVYPFMLVPVGDHWRVGMRFACPSVTKNEGRPLQDHLAEVRSYSAALEKQEKISAGQISPPPLQGRQAVPWNDLFIFVQGLAMIMSNRSDRIERRLRKMLALAHLCRQAKFDKVTGHRLEEFLALVIAAIEEEVPRDPLALKRPSWVGRILFRQILVLYVRKDTGLHRGRASRHRLALLQAAMGFALGSGLVPPVNSLLPPELTFEFVEEPRGPLSDEAEEMFERYFLMKVHSLQFTGVSNFHHSFWEGVESLVLSYPIAMWVARALPQLPRTEAVIRGLRIADDSFGFHPLLGTSRQKFSQRILSFRDEIPRLIAWYSR